MNPLNFLIVDDSVADFMLIEHRLRQDGLHAHCRRVSDAGELKDALDRGGWDVLLSDYNVPGIDIVETLGQIQEAYPDLPVILISGTVGEVVAVELLKQGVWDVVLKDHLARLVPSIERALGDAQARRDKRASEVSYHDLFESITDAITIQDADGHYLDVNRAAELMYGYPKAFFIGKRPEHFAAPGRNNLKAMTKAFRKACAGETQHFEFWGLRANGEVFPKDVRLAPVRYKEESAVISLERDITVFRRQRHREQMRLEVLEKVAQGFTLPQVLEALARAVEAEVPDALCSIHLLDEAGRHLRLGAAPSLPAFYNEAIDGLEIGPGVCSCGTAAHEGCRVVVTNIQTHPYWAAYKAVAAQAGLAASWSQPIFDSQHKVLGVFALYHRTPCSPQAPEIELIVQAAQLAAIAIEGQLTRQALANEAKRRRLLFEQSRDGIVILDLEGKVVEANQSFADMLGYSLAEARQLHIWDWDVRWTREEFLIALQADAPDSRFETSHRRRDGSLIDVEISASSMVFNEQRLVLALHRDISSRKADEAALRNSEARFNLAMRASNDGLWDWDLTSNAVYFSPGWKAMLGYRDDELEDRLSVWEHLVDAEGGVTSLARIDDCLAGQSNGFEVTYRMRHKDGHWVDVLSRGLLVRDASGKPARIVGTHVDISERRRLEQELRENEARYRRITEGLTDYVYTVYIENGRAVRATQSPACRIVTGYTPEEFDANPDLSIQMVVPEDRERVMQHVRKVLAGIAVPPIEHRIMRKNGEVYWVSNTFILFKDRSGVLLSYDGVIKDINERKLAEAAVLQLNQELENKVALRTADLEQARHAADAANQAKSTFLAMMSHEIRTPMNALFGMLEMIALQGLGGEQASMLEMAQDSGKALLAIIDDILDFSKIEAGKLAIIPEPTALAELVELITLTHVAIASSKGLVFTSNLSQDIGPAVMVDRLRLRQILNNLLSNAVKFTAHGEITLEIELIEHRDGVDVVRFTVSDSGIGIAPADQEKLFHPFSQAEADITRRFGGSGLGLVICRRLADMMGGHLDLHSVPGQGTRVSLTLSLPVVDAASLHVPGDRATTAAESITPRTAPTIAEAQAAGTLILLVDDHPTNRNVLAHQLRVLGYASEEAASSTEALMKWQTGQYGLLITDCHMPEMDGYQLTRKIRQMEADTGRARMPVLGWTADALRGVAEACRDAGMDDILIKPSTLAGLRERLQSLLAQPAASGTAPAPLPLSGPDAPPVPSRDMGSLEALLDPASLRELSGGDLVMENKILSRFWNASQVDAAALAQALADRDAVRVASLAHRMKGAARLIGASEFARTCEALEHAGKGQDWALIETAESGFRSALDRLDQALNRL